MNDGKEEPVSAYFAEIGNEMAEYLSPGVYVEEFESGSKPMEA